MTDDNRFDNKQNTNEPWGIKEPNGLYTTENKLFEAMKKIGLNPKPQYKISRMKVDFAFPEEKIVVEVNGKYHETEEQKEIDRRRNIVLEKMGWTIKMFQAEYVYDNYDEAAKEIAEIVGKKEFCDTKLENGLNVTEKPKMDGCVNNNEKVKVHRLNEEVKSTLLFAATSVAAGYVSFILTPTKPAFIPAVSLLVALASTAAIFLGTRMLIQKLVDKKDMQWIMGNGGAIYLFLWFVTWIIFYNAM